MSMQLGPRLWSVGFTGIPFGIYKAGGGLAAYQDLNPAFGLLIIAWGLLDIGLNLVSLAWPRQVAQCALANLGRWLDRRGSQGQEQLWLALDTLLAFAIVSTMIWFNRSAALPAPLPLLWVLAVIASIMGVGIERVWVSWRAKRV